MKIKKYYIIHDSGACEEKREDQCFKNWIEWFRRNDDLFDLSVLKTRLNRLILLMNFLVLI